MKTAGVLMPCRGYLPHVKLAVESILKQTHQDFEFLIINDASEAPVREYFESLKDSRIQIVHHETALGVSRSLNKGLRLIQSEIVLRMDSDDIARPNRIELQCGHLIRHPEVTVLGGQIKHMSGNARSPKVPVTHGEIGYRLNWSNALNHPTVAYRKKAILENGGYDETLGPLEEDLELWTRLFFLTKLENLDQTILDYRLHPDQTSRVHRTSTETVRSGIRQTFRLKLTGCYVSPIFDYQDRWTESYRPDQEEWEVWTTYLHRLHETTLFDGKDKGGDHGRDLARRFWHSARRYREVGGCPENYRATTRHFNRWYAMTKGVF